MGEKLETFEDIEKPKPDFDYANGGSEVKRGKLQEIAGKSSLFPLSGGDRKIVRPWEGYFHFPPVTEAEMLEPAEQALRKAREPIMGLLDPSYADYMSRKAERLERELPQSMENYAGAARNLYKIHLMPRQEFIPFVVSRLLEAMERDVEFRNSIHEFKVYTGGKKAQMEDVLPAIVLYPHLTKESAQLALDKIYQCLQGCDALSTGECPRYSREASGMVYYTQGDGDIKKIYREFLGKTEAKDGGVFNPDFVHLRGDDNKLKLPQEK